MEKEDEVVQAERKTWSEKQSKHGALRSKKQLSVAVPSYKGAQATS